MHVKLFVLIIGFTVNCTTETNEITSLIPEASSESTTSIATESTTESTTETTATPTDTSSTISSTTGSISTTEGTTTNAAISSAEISTTSVPVITTVPSPDQHNTITFKTSCVLLVGDIQWTIPFNDSSGQPQTEVIGLQTSAVSHVNGTCNGTLEDVLYIWLFNNTWLMSITFGSNKDKIWWNEVSLTYVFDEIHFPNHTAILPVTYKYTFSEGFKANQGGSYECTSETNTEMSNGYVLHTWNIQYTAFQINVTEFTGDKTKCNADKSTNHIVPIVVGVTLVVFTVSVLGGFMYCRRRSRRGYKTITDR